MLSLLRWLRPLDAQNFSEFLPEDLNRTGEIMWLEKAMIATISGIDDILAYSKAFRKCHDIFLERREQYGSHLDKDEFEDIAGLYLKTSRINRDIADHKEINEDTLVDLINYGLQVLSRRVDAT